MFSYFIFIYTMYIYPKRCIHCSNFRIPGLLPYLSSTFFRTDDLHPCSAERLIFPRLISFLTDFLKRPLRPIDEKNKGFLGLFLLKFQDLPRCSQFRTRENTVYIMIHIFCHICSNSNRFWLCTTFCLSMAYVR